MKDRLYILLCIVTVGYMAFMICLGMGPGPSEVEASEGKESGK